MGRLGFMIVLAVVIVGCTIPGVIFISKGAWPIFGFLGLDILLIWLAFRANFSAARAYETVVLTPESLIIRHVTARGKLREFVLDPNWSKLKIMRTEDGVQDVVVTTRDKAVAIGRFLPPEEKESFARAFAPALANVTQFGRR